MRWGFISQIAVQSVHVRQRLTMAEVGTYNCWSLMMNAVNWHLWFVFDQFWVFEGRFSEICRNGRMLRRSFFNDRAKLASRCRVSPQTFRLRKRGLGRIVRNWIWTTISRGCSKVCLLAMLRMIVGSKLRMLRSESQKGSLLLVLIGLEWLYAVDHVEHFVHLFRQASHGVSKITIFVF